MGLQVNNAKTELMRMDKTVDRKEHLEINNVRYGVCRRFKYFGSMADHDNDMETKTKSRIASADRCFYSLQKILGGANIFKKTKMKIYNTIIKPVLLYGCERWSLTKRMEHSLSVFENKVLRKIFGPVDDVDEQAWGRRHNH
ncbi:uncharacterized protein LOC143037327 [Oratosquilla oratoria]|uniref:uncharacterized protein LOC143037327 n=1 Tax=Oratosquilla oratoria TaxID=337810 RepID=UPI003F76888F